jgi:two-component system chemotaxis sensor kinase CheA
VLSARGDYLTLVHLHRLFGVPGAVDDPSRALVVVVETEARSHIGLVVDELLGQQQVVIKSLEANYGRVDGISGATILGNGMVALILDVDRLSQMADAAAPRRARVAPAVHHTEEPITDGNDRRRCRYAR